jgi:hypothetical protein
MGWARDLPPLPFNPGDRVYVKRSAITIDKTILGCLGTVAAASRNLVEVHRDGRVFVFRPDELILREKAPEVGTDEVRKPHSP